jgi:hypothetical protein
LYKEGISNVCEISIGGWVKPPTESCCFVLSVLGYAFVRTKGGHFWEGKRDLYVVHLTLGEEGDDLVGLYNIESLVLEKKGRNKKATLAKTVLIKDREGRERTSLEED